LIPGTTKAWDRLEETVNDFSQDSPDANAANDENLGQ
jgi:hypothetical protein